jgi:nucleoside-diphosphate-sugar epimerase
MVEMVQSGRFAWIGGGRHRTSITHVDNVVEGLVLAADGATPGRPYFVTDGDPVVFRDFITELLATQGVDAPSRSVPPALARAVAAGGERLWRLLPLPGEPPLTRFVVWVSSLDTVLDDSRARADFGYAPVIDRAQGLAELAGERVPA